MWNRDIKVIYFPLIKRFFMRRDVGWALFVGSTAGSIGVGSSFSWMTIKWKMMEDYGRGQVVKHTSGMDLTSNKYDVGKTFPAFLSGISTGMGTATLLRVACRKWLRMHELVPLRDLLSIKTRPFFVIFGTLMTGACIGTSKVSAAYYSTRPEKLGRLGSLPGTQRNLELGWSEQRDFEYKFQKEQEEKKPRLGFQTPIATAAGCKGC
eukprot:TRINITY_DN34194_c0_g1_i1.p1 TRINITY_DN34194_c0_g1~~TRINITY_DN34194_c0_g1_i1.p1  ORF type:complete len:226 (+),score=34.64 TRINITY_DN34194_c0_g1_i1:55-678(+)